MNKKFHPGMGQAVAERTILRKKDGGEWETWDDVVARVSLGNVSLTLKKDSKAFTKEFSSMVTHMSKATILMSGRHLQHGDEKQPTRNMEVFTNCGTSPTSFLEFYLLLNGSGLGRSYDDDMMVINWDNAPTIHCVLDEYHADFDWSAHESVRDAKHKYGKGKGILWHKVADSREGWAKALELWENAAFEKIHSDKMLILDFSDIRKKGSPIGGMQNRPASGPVPLMNAFTKAGTLKGANLEPWLQTMYVDHYFAECVLVGGARRAARLAVKYWKDKSIFDFCGIKRPIEYGDKSVNQVMEFREACVTKGDKPPYGFLWSSNNSVLVDAEFWKLTEFKRDNSNFSSDKAAHARKLLKLITDMSYGDGTGEPGIINVDKLTDNKEGIDGISDNYFGSEKYTLNEDTQIFMRKLAKKAYKKKYIQICNPCVEVTLSLLGGFCVIGDVAPYFADSLDEAEEAFRVTTRALIRVNTMDSVYNEEVKRTNRIGVSITGVHEFAWKFFKLGFYDLIDENKSKEFWLTMARFNRAVREESISYSKKLDLNTPHTCTTIKPAGTTSKLFGLTEGWHLPAMAWYMRWVQFRDDDPLLKQYSKMGYKTQALVQYPNTVVVGFPTEPIIATLNMGAKLITASDASMEDQYKWLHLGEKYWIDGTDASGEPLTNKYGNQISYTLKYFPNITDNRVFKRELSAGQKNIKACAVMPQSDTVAYEYQPEQAITKAEYQAHCVAITNTIKEDIGQEHIDCGSGGCPVDFIEGDK